MIYIFWGNTNEKTYSNFPLDEIDVILHQILVYFVFHIRDELHLVKKNHFLKVVLMQYNHQSVM